MGRFFAAISARSMLYHSRGGVPGIRLHQGVVLVTKRGLKKPVLAYDKKSAAALNACREFLKQAEEFLDGSRPDLPDASPIADARFPRSSILWARCAGVDRFKRDTPFVAARLEDRDRTGEQRSERYFDPWYFVVMLLLELPGGRFRFDGSKNDTYFYLAYAGPVGSEGNYYLRRIVADTSTEEDTRDEGGDSHYDYRRATLKKMAKKVIRQAGQETRSASRDREDAIQFASELFNRQHKAKEEGRPPVLNLNPEKYEALLRQAFKIADRMHEKILALRTSDRSASGMAAE
jgi:hypothetical protein